MFVTLFTSAFVSKSLPGAPFLPIMNAKIRLPIPEQYGITSVPSTVPSIPVLFIASKRQIIRKDPVRKITMNIHGASAPLLSIDVMIHFNARS